MGKGSLISGLVPFSFDIFHLRGGLARPVDCGPLRLCVPKLPPVICAALSGACAPIMSSPKGKVPKGECDVVVASADVGCRITRRRETRQVNR